MGVTIAERSRWLAGAAPPTWPAGSAPSAVVVVYRKQGGRFEYLVLHRAGADDAGDWCWTPPVGSRNHGERVKDCARREVQERTSMSLPPIPTAFGCDGWDVFLAQAPPSWVVELSDEHDRFEWLPVEEAAARCRPELVAGPVRRVADFVEGRAT